MPLSFLYALCALCALCGQNSNTEAPSELSRMFFCPALDYNLLLGIKLNRIATLPVHNPKEAVFPSAEWEIGHGSGNSDVYANVARWRFVTEAARRRTA